MSFSCFQKRAGSGTLCRQGFIIDSASTKHGVVAASDVAETSTPSDMNFNA